MVRLMKIPIVCSNELTGIPCLRKELEPRMKYE
jgi:hypothetical protein